MKALIKLSKLIMYVLHHILDAMNFYKNPFLVNFFPVNFEFTVKGFSCI